MLTAEVIATYRICLVTFSVIPLCPESPLLQPERCPDCVAHTQATCQPHTGLREPEATCEVPQLQKLHIFPGRENRQDRRK